MKRTTHMPKPVGQEGQHPHQRSPLAKHLEDIIPKCHEGLLKNAALTHDALRQGTDGKK
jgi:hypothetical protein